MDIVTAVYTSGGTIDESMRNMFVLRRNITKLRNYILNIHEVTLLPATSLVAKLSSMLDYNTTL